MTSIEAKLKALSRAKTAHTPYPAYIRWEDGKAADTACKLCGDPLTRGGTKLPSYKEIMIFFDDKSTHASPLCLKCRDAGISLPMLERIYCDDMKALAIEEEATQTLMRWEMWVDRVPVGYRSL